MITIDCRGLNCPEPVIKTKKALSDSPGKAIRIIVDNETARENVIRFARNQGRSASWNEDNGLFHISITGIETKDAVPEKVSLKTSKNKPVLLISTNLLGQGSEELGAMLMRNFIYTLTKRDDLPQAIVFMNSGVSLTIKESPAIDELLELEERGVNIVVCGTCLDYYKFKEEHRAGEVSNMYDIADLLFEAPRVITI